MVRLLNGGRVNASARSYRQAQPGSANIAECFSEELKRELYLHRHYSSQELLARFTANDGKNASLAARLAIAKLLFGLDKTIEYAEGQVRRQDSGANTVPPLR